MTVDPNKTPLTCARLKDLFFYNPSTGVFVSRVKRGNVWAGMPCGTINKIGYVVIRIDYVLHAAHRLAWLYQTGEWPEFEIDHKDGIRSNNAFDNLRDVTRSTNNENRRSGESNSTSTLLGVSFCRQTNRWKAQIALRGSGNKNLGRYDTEEQAHAAYIKAKRDLHAGCTI